MRRRHVVGMCLGPLAVSLAFALPPATEASAAEAVQIRKVDVADFPVVTLTVSTPGGVSLDPKDVQIVENGIPVPPTSVRPLGPAGGDVDVVLAIDTSNSMRGGPLETAFAAAREFVSSIPPWVRVGILTFADRSRVEVPISADHVAALAALSTIPKTTVGTALYDAVAASAGMFSGQGQHNIVLLTDGRNTAGSADLTTAASAAGDLRATVFAFGLEGADTDVPVLHELAQLTGGAFASVSPADLGVTYRSLARELSQQYLVTYRSRAPHGSQVAISVRLPGGTDRTVALAPPPPGTSNAISPEPLDRLLRGPWGLTTVFALCYLAFFLLIFLVLGGKARAHRERQLAARMSAQPRQPPKPAPRAERSPLTAWIPVPMVGAAERVARAGGFADRIDRWLERAGLPIRAGEFVAATAVAALAGGALGGVAFRNVFVALALAAVAGVAPAILLSVGIGKRAERLQGQLPDLLMVLASSLRAGHSFMQALDMVTKEVGEPASPEFARTVAEIRLGRPVDDAMNAMAERIRGEDFAWAVTAINIQRKVGGNLAEILENVAETIRERETIRRQVRVLSAEGRLSVAILTVLPFLIGIYILSVNPEYIGILIGTGVGQALLAGAATLMVVGYLWMQKIVNLDV